jgi:hypothetical protein
MSDSFFKINRGVTLNPQSEYGSGDPAGTNGDIYYNNVLGKFRKYQNGAWSDLDVASGNGSGNPWVAQEVNLSIAVTSVSVSFSSTQPDTSYVVLAIMENLVDPFPQIQQVEVIAKSTTGFTAIWNMPLDSANYKLSFIVPPKWLEAHETPIGMNAALINVLSAFPQATTTYPVLGMLQNLVDAYPKFQPVIVTTKSTTNAIFQWNVGNDTANYSLASVFGGSAQVSIGSGQTTVTIPLPVDYGTTGYGVMVTASNLSDTLPQFQPLVITAKSTNSVTVLWNAPTATANYVLTCFAISATP